MTSLNAQAVIDEWNNGINLVDILEIMVPQVGAAGGMFSSVYGRHDDISVTTPYCRRVRGKIISTECELLIWRPTDRPGVEQRHEPSWTFSKLWFHTRGGCDAFSSVCGCHDELCDARVVASDFEAAGYGVMWERAAVRLASCGV